MMGFVVFIFVVVLGVLGLVRGLQILGVVGARDAVDPPPISRGEIERLQDALAALESRVETLHEEQRFLERLLAERKSPDALPSGPSPDRAEDDDESILFDTREG